MRSPDTPIAFRLNGAPITVIADPARRLADVLRDDLDLTGTKIGCNAGDCGACTVLLDGRQVCACMVATAQVAGRDVTTVEGLAPDGRLGALQAAFLRNGAVQCGICTPGMLMAATELLAEQPHPTEAEVLDALGGVLCRCTGYRAIIAAVLDAAATLTPERPAGAAVGARLPRRDGPAKLTGAARFGADVWPDEAWLAVRAIRSAHPHARFTLGDFAPLRRRHGGLVAVLTARDVPGRNLFRDLPHRQGPAGAGRWRGALSRRAGVRAGRRSRHAGRDRRGGDPDRLGRAATGHVRHHRGRARPASARAGQRALPRPAATRRCGRGTGARRGAGVHCD